VFSAGGKRRVALTHSTTFGWRLIVQQDYDEAYATVIAANRIGYLLLICTALLALLAAGLIARWLTRPIEHLTAVAVGISTGELDRPIEETGRADELGDLARAIARLRMSVQVALTELGRKA
jgi:methyl-accepting chemotaxis protein